MKLHPYFLRMSLSILIMTGAGLFFAHSLKIIFLNNPGLNALILTLTFSGILFAFYQLYRLKNDGKILENLKQDQWSASSLQRAIFLEPIIVLLQEKNTD